MKEIMKAAHQLRAESPEPLTMADALAWAWQCWREREGFEERERQAYFERARIRRNCVRVVPAVERFEWRTGIERGHLTRREKIQDNEDRLKKGLEPKHWVA